MKTNPNNHLEALIALRLVHQLGDQRIRLLLQHVEHPGQIFAMSKGELQTIDGIGESIAAAILDFDDWNRVDRILRQSRKIDAQIIHFYDDSYPALLREIYDPPILLWVKGDPAALDKPGVAVVGTRRASSSGLKTAAKFSKQLANKGLTVYSGLAYGVDAAAHKATLRAGGPTVAVLGSGIDVIYPKKHAGLAASITKQKGAVITEFLPGAPPDAGNFPVRNRIVSGLSLGTLVIESGLKGGSMITAQSALRQNREVFVIPHELANASGVGCNHLIKRGAGKLVQTLDDILEELPHYQTEKLNGTPVSVKTVHHWKKLDLDEPARAICKLLEEQNMHIDDMSEALGKTSHEVLSKLLELEMQDCVRQRAGKNFELK